jgi:hypothetical protein
MLRKKGSFKRKHEEGETKKVSKFASFLILCSGEKMPHLLLDFE